MNGIIGLVGYAQVGKDSAAHTIVELGFEHRAFAEKLRRLAERVDPYLPDGRRYTQVLMDEGYEQAKKDVPHFREYLKDMGNGVREILGPSVWADGALWDAPSATVMSDCRFVNEADAIRDHADQLAVPSLLLRIERPGYGPESDFEREVPLIECDYEIVNDSTVAELALAVRTVVDQHCG